MKKIRFAALLFLLAALLCISVCASGVQVVDSGTWGNISWTLYDDGELQISGTGDMPDTYDTNRIPWAAYRQNVLCATVSHGVTSIGVYTFYGCSNLTSVTIPAGVTEIGQHAFFGCSSLTGVTIPEGVTKIGGYIFEGCSSLTSVTIPEGVTAIGNHAFSGCSSLTSVTIPESVTSIGDSAFSDCSSLTSVTIPDSVTSIGDSAFSDCSSLTSVTIPDSVTSIGNSTFSGCSSLASVTIPESVTSIGNSRFSGCSSLTSVTIPDSVTSIGYDAFYDCSSLTSAEFLGDAPSLGSSVFQWVDGAFIIYFHAGKSGWTSPTWNGYRAACIEAPEEYSLLDGDNCNSQHIRFTLNSEAGTATVGGGYDGGAGGRVVIPDTVTKDGVSYRVIGIDAGAFQDNVYVKSVQLGSNLSSISAQPFYGCANLEEFRLSADNDRYSVVDGILYDYVGYNLYIYPAGKDMESFAVPDTVKTISAGAFCDAKNLRAVTVPDSVTSIGSEAFRGCTGLETVVLPFLGGSKSDENSFAYIFGDTWSFNYVLKDVTILGESLKGSDFACSVNLVGGIERIILPACGETIPYSSFSGCESLDTLVFSDIGAIMENGVLTIPNEVTSLGNNAFSDCLAIRQVHIPASVQSISASSFRGCDGLTGFTVAEDNLNYSSDKWGVLFDQDSSTLLQYPASRVWPYYNVPDGTVSISSYAFDTCKNLVNLYIPETVSRLSYSSVMNCPSTTLCVRLDSPADRYATSNNHRVWYIDNYTLQGIEVYSLPEQTIFEVGQVDFAGLYLAANYGGTRLQLDNYQLDFDSGRTGVQTVTVSSGGRTAEFEVLLYDSENEEILRFEQAAELHSDETAFAALYDLNGKMLAVYEAKIFDGAVTVAVPQSLRYQTAKLFILDSGTWSPRMMYKK